MAKNSPKSKNVSTVVNKKSRKEADGGCWELTAKCITATILIFFFTFIHYDKFVYGTHTFFIDGKGDISTRHFADDLNTMMCQAYDVSPGTPADVYLVSGRAKIAPRKWHILKRNNSQLFPGSYNRDNAFYLLEGSYIKINACRIRERFDPDVEKVNILLFKGEQSWEDWKNGKCDDCSLKRKTLPNHFCKEGGETVMRYHVEDRDTYYVAVTKRNGYQDAFLNVRATLEIMQTTFDTSNALQECHMTTDCVLNLTYSSDVDVVVKFSDYSTFNQFTTECKYRLMFWEGVLVIVPGCIIALLLLCCGCVVCCEKRDRKKKKQLGENKVVSCNEKANLVKNELPPGYSSSAHPGYIQIV